MPRKLSVPFVVTVSNTGFAWSSHVKEPACKAHHLNTDLLTANLAAGVTDGTGATNTSLLVAFSAGGVKAALSKGAVGPTGIAALIIAVVTEFARGDQAVAAARCCAEHRAAVVVVLISIITSFAWAHHPIAASCSIAIGETFILVDIVTIITGLHTALNVTITANGQGAVDTGIAVVFVFVIAGLYAIDALHNSITADRQGTVPQAGVTVVVIAVIAGLISAC
jgi:hypothetical protein